MGFSLTSPAPEKGDPTAKNRVWGFFGDAQEMHRTNRPQSLQPRQGNRLTTTKIALGRTYWPSRDPIGERGGENLYGMVSNNAVGGVDFLGLYCDGVQIGDAKLESPWKLVGLKFDILAGGGIFTINSADAAYEAECTVCCECVDGGIMHLTRTRRSEVEWTVNFGGNVVGGGAMIPIPAAAPGFGDLVGELFGKFVGDAIGNAAYVFTSGSWAELQQQVIDRLPKDCKDGRWYGLGGATFFGMYVPVTNPCAR